MLSQYLDATAFAVLVFTPAPIDPSSPMIFRPDMTAKPAAVDLNDPAQNGRGGMRYQTTAQLVQ
jgi:hypothetical protein